MGIIRSLAKTNQLFRNCTFWSYEKLDPTVKISVTVNAASKETCGQSNNVYDSGRPEIERTLWRGAERHGNWLTPVSVDRHFVRATDLPLAAVDAPVPSLTAAAPGPRDTASPSRLAVTADFWTRRGAPPGPSESYIPAEVCGDRAPVIL